MTRGCSLPTDVGTVVVARAYIVCDRAKQSDLQLQCLQQWRTAQVREDITLESALIFR